MRLQNMAALLLAGAHCAAVWLGTQIKLKILALHVLKAAKRVLGIPDFRYYALAEGIQKILKRIGKGPLRQQGGTGNIQHNSYCLISEFLGKLLVR
jgi:hypothetical protein